MADGYVDTNNALAFLVYYGVNRDSGFAGTTVADDKFPLAAADGNHGVNCFNTGLQRLFNRLAGGNAGSVIFNRTEFGSSDRPFAVNRLTDGIYNPANHSFANGNLHDSAGTADRIAFFDQNFAAEQYRADVVFFKVEHHTVDIIWKFQELAGHGFFQTVNTGDTVTHLDNSADIVNIEVNLVAAQSAA